MTQTRNILAIVAVTAILAALPTFVQESEATLWMPCYAWTCPAQDDVGHEIGFTEYLNSSSEYEYTTQSYCGDDVRLNTYMYYGSGTITIYYQADSTIHDGTCASSTMNYDHLGIEFDLPGTSNDFEWETDNSSGWKTFTNTGISQNDYVSVSAHFVYE